MTHRRIAICSNGRFHVLDLARELSALGHDVRFYSWVPRKRAVAFGLPEAVHAPLLGRLAHVAAWAKYLPGFLPELHERTALSALNAAIIDTMSPCNEFIGMSGVTLEAARHAKSAFGARIWIERGSQHIEAQGEILAGLPGARVPTKRQMSRELESYAVADRITVPSRHVMRSFARDPASAAKLFVNPYGVCVERFPQPAAPRPDHPPTVLMVGGWSLRKGVDLLTEAVMALDGVRLLHVGALVDAPFPNHPRFEHHDPVDQSRLPEFYARGHVFALASREEGLALVQAQALASGLPVVCSDRTGGVDLAHTPELAERIREVSHEDGKALRVALATCLSQSLGGFFSPCSEAARATLSWGAYAQRYSAEILARDMVHEEVEAHGST